MLLGRFTRERAVAAMIAALMLLAPVTAAHASAATLQAPAELQVKAALLLNFLKFVTWTAAERPIGICIANNPALTAAAMRAASGQVINGRNVAAIGLSVSNPLEACDLLYLADLKPDDASAILSRVRGPVLTVGETPRFLRDGGMVRIFVDANRLRFQVNRGPIVASGLKVSSQLMQLGSQ